MSVKFLAAALALFAIITPASANVLDVTVTGTVSGGTDVYSLFGPPGADMTGAQFTANYSVDLANPSVVTFDGGVKGNGGPAAIVDFTINNHTIEFAGQSGFWITDSAQYVFQTIDTPGVLAGVDTQPGTSNGFFSDYAERFSLDVPMPVSAVPLHPLPLLGQMLLLGLGGFGLLAYRRKNQVAA